MNSPLPPLNVEELMARIRLEVQKRKAERAASAKLTAPAKSWAVPYRWGDRLAFSVGGNGLPYLREGWAEPEPTLLWSAAPAASIELPIAPPSGDLMLRLQAHAFTCPAKTAQRIRLRIDQTLLAEWAMIGFATHSTIIFQRHLAGKDRVILQFEFPDACSPKSAALSDDVRNLGMALATLELGPLRAV